MFAGWEIDGDRSWPVSWEIADAMGDARRVAQDGGTASELALLQRQRGVRQEVRSESLERQRARGVMIACLQIFTDRERGELIV